jgi:hypothetical protein
MSRHHITILLLLLTLLAGCGANETGGPSSPPSTPSTATPPPTFTPAAPLPSPTPAPAALGAPLRLRVGETAAVGPLTLTLAAIANDSRCPTQVSCFWEGAAEATLEVVAPGRDAQTITLTLNGQNRETEDSRAQVAEHTIRLTTLDPYPVDTQPIAQGDYVATVVVEQASVGYTAVSDGTFEGVIVPKGDAPGADPQAQGYWTPAEQDVLALEAGLAAFLRDAAPERSPDLWQKQPTYKRQYIGLLRDGKRLVYASFFCSTEGDGWRSQVLFVLDGGDCFFQLTYDVERDTYGDLMVNGDA